ncbi:protein kinase Rad3 [Atractiella rhizophila]|nr:protein kinase Rad3 [Atractiella rhizophila]
MQLLRVNIDSLMSVLETFVHDPLVEWTETDRRSKRRPTVPNPADTSVDPRAQEALKVLQEVEQKLSGLRATFNSPSTGRVVTAENQVESLIREAMDDGNLGSMYVGWAAFL